MFFDPEERNLLQAAIQAQQKGQPTQNEQFLKILAQYGKSGINSSTESNLKDITNSTQQAQREDVKFVFTVPKMLDPDPITCVIEPTEELGGLYIGGVDAATNIDMLKKFKIRAVLTASIETGVQYQQEYVHFHEVIQAHDKESYDIVQHFDKAIDFIDRNRKFTNVLVHCFLGISRSASLIVAYLIKRYNMSFEKALWKLKSRRRQVNPNVGFVRQLQNFEKLQTLGKASQIVMAPQVYPQLMTKQQIPMVQQLNQQMMNTQNIYVAKNPDVENMIPQTGYTYKNPLICHPPLQEQIYQQPQYQTPMAPLGYPQKEYIHQHQNSAQIHQLPPL